MKYKLLSVLCLLSVVEKGFSASYVESEGFGDGSDGATKPMREVEGNEVFGTLVTSTPADSLAPSRRQSSTATGDSDRTPKAADAAGAGSAIEEASVISPTEQRPRTAGSPLLSRPSNVPPLKSLAQAVEAYNLEKRQEEQEKHTKATLPSCGT
jgi:hypothetical protein